MSIRYYSVLMVLLISAAMARAQPRWSDYQYDPDDSAFPNPSRGFYKYTSRGNAEESISTGSLESIRENGYTLIYRIYYIGDYVESPISLDYLDRIREDFQVVRQTGLKVILRFAYTSKSTEPYGDASPDWVLHHIGQLRPLIRENADVIAVWQAGFIGAWGEWYYTDHFATGSPNIITEEDLAEREAVVRAMLEALPSSRQIQLRTPEHKRRIFGDVPLSAEQAYDGSDQARTGHHNDCFLSSSTDVGTYHSSIDRPYLLEDSKYTSMGGETCRWYEARSNCDTARVEMDRYNWTYLNIDYFGETIQQWKDNGCFDEIWNKLGYRYRMVSASFMDSARSGGAFAGRIELVNEGYANPMNERYPELVLRNVNTDEAFYLRLDQDLRRFPEGEPIVLEFAGGITGSIPAGYYELFLNLPDPMPALARDPRYSIRLANQEVWEDESGYNATGHTLVVDPQATGMEDPGGAYFIPRSSTGLNHYRSIDADGDPGDWEGIPSLEEAPGNDHALSLSIYNDANFLYGLALGEGLDVRTHRFFFDLDRDPATGYVHPAWVGGGAEIMVDNGEFKQYTGQDGGDDWLWKPAGDIDFIATGTTVEWALPLDLIPGVQEFSLGYENSIGGVSGLEYIPAAGTAMLKFRLDQFLEETPELFATTYSDNALLYWGLREGDQGFRLIERAYGPGEPFRVLTLLSPDVVSYTDRNLVPSTTFRYRSYLSDGQMATLPTQDLEVTPAGEAFRYTQVEPDGLDADWKAVAPVTAVYDRGNTTVLRLFGDRTFLNFLLTGAGEEPFRMYVDTDPGEGTGSGPGLWEGEAFDWQVTPDSVYTWDGKWTYQGAPEIVRNPERTEGRLPYALSDPAPGLAFRVGVVTGETGGETLLPFGGKQPAVYERLMPAAVPEGFVVKQSLADPSGRLIPEWVKNTEVDGYDLERSPDDSLQFGLIASPGKKDYRYIDEDVEPDSDYWYRLRSYNTAGPSAYTPAVFGHTFGVGIESLQLDGSLTVYPNPAGTVLHLRLDQPGLEISGAGIYDMTGRQVAEFRGNVRSLELEGIPSGLYQLRVETGQGTLKARFVKR